jgi:hypothetical protein
MRQLRQLFLLLFSHICVIVVHGSPRDSYGKMLQESMESHPIELRDIESDALAETTMRMADGTYFVCQAKSIAELANDTIAHQEKHNSRKDFDTLDKLEKLRFVQKKLSHVVKGRCLTLFKYVRYSRIDFFRRL